MPTGVDHAEVQTLDAPRSGFEELREGRFHASDVIDGAFQLIRPLGRGGMGEVFIARDLNLGRRVALKTVLLPAQADPAQRTFLLQLFRRDAATTAQLSHAQIVTIYHFGVHEDVPYMTLELIEGSPLDRLLRTSGPMPERQALGLMGDLARALSYAHRRGIIHRDIKPENLMRTDDGELKVLDFGVALIRRAKARLEEDFGRSASDLEAHLGHMPLTAGTPAYMAPEQRAGLTQGPGVDAWALGVTLYELIAGGLPPLPDLPSEGAPFVWPPSVPAHERTRELVLSCLRTSPRERLCDLDMIASTLDEIIAELDANAPLEVTNLRTNINPPHDTFIGREELLNALGEVLTPEDAPVLTLVGPGGVGKTRLIIEWARRAMEEQPSLEVFFVDLTQTTDIDGLLQATALAFNIPLTQKDPIVQLRTVLSSRPNLTLILDNAERALEPLSELTTQGLDRGLPTRVVITSRVPLRIQRERIFEVNPISSNSQEARALFEARARSVSPGWACPPHEEEALSDLLVQLDGLPLAIELAASRARVLTPSKMLARMNQRFKLLRSSKRGVSGRQATLLETMEWSWGMLDDAQRSMLSQLGVFEGGASLEAVEEVVDLSSLDDDPFAIDILEELVERSLLRLDPDTQRLHMLMSIQEFARRKLAATDMFDVLSLRHANYYAQWVTRHGPELEVEPPRSIHGDFENIERARIWALGRDDADLTARLSLMALHCVTQTGPLAHLLRIIEDLTAGSTSHDRSSHEVRCHAANSVSNGGHDATALQWLTDAVDDAERHGDHRAHCARLHARALIHGNNVNDHLAERDLEHALRLAHLHGFDGLLATIEGSMGSRLLDMGDFERAIPLLERGLAFARTQRDLDQEARLILLIAIAHNNHTGDTSWRDRAHSAIAGAIDRNNLLDAARWSIGIGFMELGAGNQDTAYEFLRSSYEAAQRVGLQRTKGLAAGGLGEIAMHRGELALARQHMLEAHDIALAMSDHVNVTYWLGMLGEVALLDGALDEAQDKLSGALARAEQLEHLPWVLAFQAKLGLVAHARGELDEAKRCAEIALDVHAQQTLSAQSEYVAPLIALCGELGVSFEPSA